jgi:DNA mismatch repair protein MutS2
VLVGTLDGKPGRVVACKGDEARVVVGSLTLTVPLATLTRTAAPPPPPVKVAVYGAVDAEGPVHEVDLRGLRVDELDDRLFSAVDAAVRADLREVRIIHGKGTGALRARVAELLRKDTRVTGSRLGAWNEGGAGVTVAELA